MAKKKASPRAKKSTGAKKRTTTPGRRKRNIEKLVSIVKKRSPEAKKSGKEKQSR